MGRAILVAEDEPRNRRLVRDVLLAKGFEVLEAENGREAVAAARRDIPDLILMDMQLPVVDGFEAVRALKKDDVTAGIAVWALTSYAMPGDERRARDAGCDAYITKPIDVPTFIEKVTKYFRDMDQT